MEKPLLFLVTGGAGFIGSHLTDRLLAQGARVRVLDDLSTGRHVNPNSEFIRADVADRAAVHAAMQGVDGCFHLAAIASVARGNEDWLGTHRANQTGSVTVFDCAREAGRVPVVYASSAAIYGPTGAEAVDERAKPAPLTAYGADKLGSELHARVAMQVHEVPTVGLRFFNVYGPRQDPDSPYSGVISIFAKRIAAGLPVSIHGDGGQSRDFVYVADVVAHLAAAMTLLQREGGCHLANVCTGRSFSVGELASLLGELAGGDTAVAHGAARTGDIRYSLGDPSHATRLFGVRAKTGLRDGLGHLLASLAG